MLYRYFFLALLLAPLSAAQAQWAHVPIDGVGFPNPPFLEEADGTLFLGTFNAGLHRSDDDGAAWEPTGVGGQTKDFHAHHGDLFVTVDFEGPYRSTDGGANWTLVNSGLPTADFPNFPSIGSHGDALFVGTNTGLYRSDDAGTSWQPVDAPDLNGESILDIVSDGTSLFVAADRLYRSTDGGATFSVALDAAPINVPNALAVSGSYVLAAAEYAVYRSGDGGETWTSSDAGFEPPFPRPYGLAAVGGSVLTVSIRVGEAVGYFYHAELGDLQFVDGSGMQGKTFARVIGVGGAYVYTAIGTQVWRHALSDFGISTAVEDDDTSAEAMRLDGHPNPFHGTAALTLALDRPQPVRAEVLDVLGRRVAVLHDGALAAGTHTLALDGAGLPVGVYVVRVQGERATRTQRLTLVR